MSITQLAAAVSIIVNILPLITQLIKTFEVPGFGPEKKEGVLEVVKLILEGAEQMGAKGIPITVVLTLVDAVIDGVVHFYNLIGVFRKNNPSGEAA